MEAAINVQKRDKRKERVYPTAGRMKQHQREARYVSNQTIRYTPKEIYNNLHQERKNSLALPHTDRLHLGTNVLHCIIHGHSCRDEATR